MSRRSQWIRIRRGEGRTLPRTFAVLAAAVELKWTSSPRKQKATQLSLVLSQAQFPQGSCSFALQQSSRACSPC